MNEPRLIVEVEIPSGGRLTVALPSDALVDDLLPGLVELSGGRSDSAGWKLAPKGELALAGNTTLGESGLFPGAVLVLIEPSDQPGAQPDGQGWADLVPAVAHLVPAVAQRIRAGLRPAAQQQSIDRLSTTDYLHLLDDAIAAPEVGFGPSMVVAVMSERPGAGSTTVTALLATILSRLRSDELVAVDGNPESGALSHWLVPDSRVSGKTYRSLFDEALTPEHVQGTLMSAGPGLTVLPGPADASDARAANAKDWSRLIEHLRHLHHTVIIDCGAGFHRAASRAAIDTADHVVLVTKQQTGKLESVAPALETIRRSGRTAVLVANQARRRARSMQSTLAAQGVHVVTIPYEPQSAARLKTRGFAWGEAPASWQESVRELAAILVGSRGAPAG